MKNYRLEKTEKKIMGIMSPADNEAKKFVGIIPIKVSHKPVCEADLAVAIYLEISDPCKS